MPLQCAILLVHPKQSSNQAENVDKKAQNKTAHRYYGALAYSRHNTCLHYLSFPRRKSACLSLLVLGDDREQPVKNTPSPFPFRPFSIELLLSHLRSLPLEQLLRLGRRLERRRWELGVLQRAHCGGGKGTIGLIPVKQPCIQTCRSEELQSCAARGRAWQGINRLILCSNAYP